MIFDVSIYSEDDSSEEDTLVEVLTGVDVRWHDGRFPQAVTATDATGQVKAVLRIWEDFPIEILADCIRFKSGYITDNEVRGFWELRKPA